ncbi:MAG: sulfotransferase family protein [Gammaproteobacteria bacterium]|nr:sulfotransferase family protein [Gammaproteobacteria bacterium]NIM73716.1 sulfotransferase family protein [Gammaproteobacteria bacterium]NIN37390.1 sulfotransferase family protein [Gammaproteobacteria bacterium]NIO25549.1 sulfotransferase family protein [Gammaproteobacteria bacterium]NIO66224.1 sulfotransferase family protein [Gammaproteobacteria bacterium]
MTLAVIGAGFGRTGTLSLKLALEQLGFGPCYHMLEVLANPAHDGVWRAATRGEAVDWDALFDGYAAAVDWPVAAFWRELSDHYPEAKLVLSVRDAAQWHRSAVSTIFRAISSKPDPGNIEARVHRAMTRELILERTFGGRMDDPVHAIGVYENHNRTVHEGVPAERLLVYETGSGWEPLCAFLGCAVPDEPYPHRNTRAEFHQRHARRTPSGD